jgi:predicted Zn finger-like uncharacterized protein
MSVITNCPSCQTQFIVTETQLDQHNGQVRCGHCLHVFNAIKELIDSNSEIYTTEELEIPKKEITNTTRNNVQKVAIKNKQDRYFNDISNSSKKKNSKLTNLLIFTLVFIGVLQSIYFLRTEITIYYPNSKNYLLKICKAIGCNIDLPKKIDLIVIDDSDIHEDENYLGVIHLSSTLINRGNFSQAYPNLELTLTDNEDKPKLRRVFRPVEYLTDQSTIANGLAAGEEIKIKLAINAQNTTVAGYRLFLSY